MCKRCDKEYDNNMVSIIHQSKDLEKYKLCTDCRKYKLCKNCGEEFKHHQNKTCSKKCTQELKEKSWIESCGAKHNFYKNSSSRMEWENKLLKEEGITNVFQRDSVKEKSKISIIKKFGVDSISRSSYIKDKKSETLKNTIRLNPTLFKDNWYITHKHFLDTIGYDPRLHIFGKASKESLIIFNPLLTWCLENNILIADIYIGIDSKKEYFISSNNKIYFYDFTIRSRKIIIEFNGVLFHAKPGSKIWSNPFTGESIEENLVKSKIKIDTALEGGFKLLEIWSDEHPVINLELCKKFIILNI
jgi:hypothetical protein